MPRMTDEEVLAEMQADTKLNAARAKFSAASARIEQGQAQLRPLRPIEVRRLEFEAVKEIAEALGVKL
jgi:hypothetical protein